jgi:hypothetical protein
LNRFASFGVSQVLNKGFDVTGIARFSAYAAEEGAHHRHATTAASFEAAALEFVENWHPAAWTADELTVIVVDCESGCEQCFTVDIGAGAVKPC